MIIKKIMPKSSIAKKRVAAYCRVSTLREDQVESFETQRRYYTDLIESHPEWEMVKIYADRHSATKAENRPGFQEMAADAQARKLDIILCKTISRFSRIGSTKVMEAAVIVVVFMTVSLLAQGMPLQEVSDTFMQGVKGAMPAIIILALAYPLNALSKEMGTANFIINSTAAFLQPKLLPFVIFIVSAIMAFATGSSWGTFAICLPIALPMAYSATGNETTMLVAACFAAVAGGGVFGDHCSPVSDKQVVGQSVANAGIQRPFVISTKMGFHVGKKRLFLCGFVCTTAAAAILFVNLPGRFCFETLNLAVIEQRHSLTNDLSNRIWGTMKFFHSNSVGRPTVL